MLLDTAGPDDGGYLLLQYAAIDWSRKRVVLDTREAMIRVATWGVELTRAFDFLVTVVDVRERGHFACPTVFIDLADHVRLGFFVRDPARLPPELTDASCAETAFVFVIGRLLHDLVDFDAGLSDHPLIDIVNHSTVEQPEQRYPTLADLRRAFLALGGRKDPFPSKQRWRAWQHTERGIGYLLVDRPIDALDHFQSAQGHDASFQLARQGAVEAVRRRPDLLHGKAYAHARNLDWCVIGPEIRQRERARDFRGALEILRATRLQSDTRTEVLLATARCCLGNGEHGEAIDLAQRLLAEVPTLVEAHRVRALGLFAANRPIDALEAIEAWLAVAPTDGLAHHTRGKAKLMLGKVCDARASFDRATQLAPELVAAAFLRTNLDRKGRDLRTTVGLDAHRGLDVPEHLAELAPILSAGRILDAIVWLTDRYADPAARRLLATCHEFAGDHEAALAIHEHCGDVLGTARCLIELGRADEALEILPDDATDLRADALEHLGRTDEAAEVRQHIAWRPNG